jgi:hypothetical protein
VEVRCEGDIDERGEAEDMGLKEEQKEGLAQIELVRGM